MSLMCTLTQAVRERACDRAGRPSLPRYCPVWRRSRQFQLLHLFISLDQKPIEAQAMVSACLEAYRATSDASWYEQAQRAFDWFLGWNDLGLELYSATTGGCRDARECGPVGLGYFLSGWPVSVG